MFATPKFWILLALLLTISCNKEDPLAFVEIPDDAFLEALIEKGVDQNGDGKICVCEAEEITSLDLSYRNISNMTGIEAFVNLDTLSFIGNPVTSLILSDHKALKFLLWQSAYAELFFSDTLWPDYSEEEFRDTITFFSERERRFGKP